MPVLSSLHQLFDTDTCVAYIHTLRRKDRPLQCPRCQSQDVDPWGQYHYRPGCKRSWCNGCKRTFNDLTNTLLHQSKRSLSYWILATFLLCLACSSRRIAREVGVQIRTSYRWCWWLRNAALSYEMERQLEGTVEADELYHTAGQKGQAHHGGKKSLGSPRAWSPQETRAWSGPLCQRSAGDHRVGQSPGSCRHAGDPRFHREDRAEVCGPRRPHGQSAVDGLGQQLSGTQGLCA